MNIKDLGAEWAINNNKKNRVGVVSMLTTRSGGRSPQRPLHQPGVGQPGALAKPV